MNLQYLEPLTVKDAVSALASHSNAKVLAGGTDVVVRLKEKTLKPGYLINIGNIPGLSYIDFDGKTLRLGALTKLREIEKSPLLQEKFNIICQAASRLADIAVRNVATLGGNLCNAAPSADMVPALMVLNAAVKIAGSAGERTVPVEKFFTGPYRTALKPDELLLEIEIPTPPANAVGVYIKQMIRGSGGLGSVGVAVLLTLDSSNGVCTDARIALGAVAPTPIRARKAEALLKGNKVTAALLEKVGEMAVSETSPRDSIRGSAEYKKELVRVLTADAIKSALEKVKGG